MCRLVRLFLRQHLFGIQRFERQWLFVLCRSVRRFARFLFRLFLRRGRHDRRSRFFCKRQAEIRKVQLVKIDLRQHGRLRLRGDLFFRLGLRQQLFRLLFDKLFGKFFRQRFFCLRLGLFGE